MLLTFLISLLTLYIPAPAAHAPTSWGWCIAGVVGMTLMNAVAYWVGSSSARRLSGSPSDGMRAARIFKVLKIGIVAFVFLDVFAFEWPAVVARMFLSSAPQAGALPVVPLVGDLILLAPVLVMITTGMAFRYYYERSRLPGASAPNLGLGRYLLLRLRTELGILLLPWLLIVFVSDTTAMIWGQSAYFGYIDTGVSLALIGGLVALGPAALQVVWDTSSLAPGKLRDRLEALADRNDFKFRDILVWHTHKHIPNAAVIGPLGAFRYVLVTDALLENCTEAEVEGIFAHEVAHIKHNHLGFYLLFAVTYAALFANVTELLGRWGLVEPLTAALSQTIEESHTILLLVFTVVYWVFGFGYVSRRLEQQADLFGLRRCTDPDAFIRALQKLSLLSGRPDRSGSWRHFSISRRTRFLRDVLEDPERGTRSEKRAARLRIIVKVVFALSALRLLYLYVV